MHAAKRLAHEVGGLGHRVDFAELHQVAQPACRALANDVVHKHTRSSWQIVNETKEGPSGPSFLVGSREDQLFSAPLATQSRTSCCSEAPSTPPMGICGVMVPSMRPTSTLLSASIGMTNVPAMVDI